MADFHSLPLKTLVQEFNLEVEFASSDFDSVRLSVPDVARPGLLLTGFFDHFDPHRLQVLGRVEMSYLEKISEEQQLAVFDKMFSFKIPALLIARGMQPYPACIAMAQKHNVTLLRSKEPTSEIQSALIAYLSDQLAPRITRHGVLIEIYGDHALIAPQRSHSYPYHSHR